eukprot:8283441-Pyramimonas_sp.AAC.1
MICTGLGVRPIKSQSFRPRWPTLNTGHFLMRSAPRRWQAIIRSAAQACANEVTRQVRAQHWERTIMAVAHDAGLPPTRDQQAPPPPLSNPQCPFCAKTFPSRVSLNTHIARAHTSYNDIARRRLSGSKCLACGKQYASAALLFQHVQRDKCNMHVAACSACAPDR